MTGIHVWEISECLSRVLDRFWLSDLPVESCARCYYQSLGKIFRFAVQCLAVFTLSSSDLVYPFFLGFFGSAAAGLFHHSHIRNDGSISVRGRWISRLYSLQISPLSSQSAIPETTASPCLSFFFLFLTCARNIKYEIECVFIPAHRDPPCVRLSSLQSEMVKYQKRCWEMLERIRNCHFYYICQKSEVCLVSFSWFSCGYW